MRITGTHRARCDGTPCKGNLFLTPPAGRSGALGVVVRCPSRPWKGKSVSIRGYCSSFHYTILYMWYWATYIWYWATSRLPLGTHRRHHSTHKYHPSNLFFSGKQRPELLLEMVTTQVKVVRSCHKNPVSTDKTKTGKTPCAWCKMALTSHWYSDWLRIPRASSGIFSQSQHHPNGFCIKHKAINRK